MVMYNLPNYLNNFIFIVIFQNIINMPCGNFLLCHMSQSQTIIKNHNGQWKSIFSEKTLCPKIFIMPHVETPLWAKCEGEAHTPKGGKLESSGTPENSELNCRGQISLHLSALGVIEKVLKCRCPKWPRMSHLDICSPSYGQKKGRESNW